MKTTETLLQTITDAAAHLAAEYRERVKALPEPGAEVGGLLDALAKAEEHAARHFAHGYRDSEGHQHADCQKNGGALCDRCQDWRDCCREKDAAVAALASYALALRAKREAA